MMVADNERRKRKITITTSPMVNISVNWTSLTEARMVSVRSVRIWILIDAGIVTCNWGRMALMLSTTAMMFAPGCRCTFMMTAGVRFIHAACMVFSEPSMMSATSDMRIGAPLR